MRLRTLFTKDSLVILKNSKTKRYKIFDAFQLKRKHQQGRKQEINSV